jgi:uncharacterized protein (TIGR02145 family)
MKLKFNFSLVSLALVSVCVFAEPTPEGGELSSFTDIRNGKKYLAITIGGKKWMAENLNYQTKTGNSWCYNNDDANCSKYGRMYDFETAKKACPINWHLPSRAEWDNLGKAVGENAGKKLKASSSWISIDGKDDNGTDNYGFSALPGGNRITGGMFIYAGIYGGWWTSTEISGALVYNRYMQYGNDDLNEGSGDKNFGLSVRCVAD